MSLCREAIRFMLRIKIEVYGLQTWATVIRQLNVLVGKRLV